MWGLGGWAAGRYDRHLHFGVPGYRARRWPQWTRCGLATVLRSDGCRSQPGDAVNGLGEVLRGLGCHAAGRACLQATRGRTRLAVGVGDDVFGVGSASGVL